MLPDAAGWARTLPWRRVVTSWNISPLSLQIGTCTTCGKKSYETRSAAKRAGRALHPDACMRAYQCGVFWHLTSSPRRQQGGGW
ncbi:hypothetical protein GCM10009525_82660 [Streptosporangium amethystogenes subsp. fukuiense]